MSEEETTKIVFQWRTPRNTSEARRVLKIGRPGVVRDVYLNSRVHNTRRPQNESLADSMARSVFEVSVHPDSVLRVHVTSGIPFLKLRRGTSDNVAFTFQSSWGNSLELDEGTGATVHVPWADTKVTLTGDEHDLVKDIPEGKNRVYYPSKYPPLGVL